VTLVPAIERGVNEHEIGKIIDLTISIQPYAESTFNPRFTQAVTCSTTLCSA
jgi:hypothetical protein